MFYCQSSERPLTAKGRDGTGTVRRNRDEAQRAWFLPAGFRARGAVSTALHTHPTDRDAEPGRDQEAAGRCSPRGRPRRNRPLRSTASSGRSGWPARSSRQGCAVRTLASRAAQASIHLRPKPPPPRRKPPVCASACRCSSVLHPTPLEALRPVLSITMRGVRRLTAPGSPPEQTLRPLPAHSPLQGTCVRTSSSGTPKYSANSHGCTRPCSNASSSSTSSAPANSSASRSTR